MAQNVIDVVVFDAVGTLIEPTPAVSEVYFKAGRRAGSLLTRDDIRERFARQFAERSSELRTSEELEELFWRRVVAAIFDDVADVSRCFEELHAHFAQPSAWRVNPDVDSLLPELRRRGVTLAVASNFDRRLHGILDSQIELSRISLRVISSELGWRKPHAEFFRNLLHRVGASPERVLMVGDDYDRDILPARAAGMRAGWYAPLGAHRDRSADTLTALSDVLRMFPADTGSNRQ